MKPIIISSNIIALKLSIDNNMVKNVYVKWNGNFNLLLTYVHCIYLNPFMYALLCIKAYII